MIEDDYPKEAAQLRAELDRFKGTCHYDEQKKKIVYHSLKEAMEAYMVLQIDEENRYKWIESEKAKHDLGKDAIIDWVAKYAASFRKSWEKTHVYINPGQHLERKLAC